jgi:hypothetical protein
MPIWRFDVAKGQQTSVASSHQSSFRVKGSRNSQPPFALSIGIGEDDKLSRAAVAVGLVSLGQRNTDLHPRSLFGRTNPTPGWEVVSYCVFDD